MDKIERLNLVEDVNLTAYDLMALAQLLGGEDELNEFLVGAILIRARRSARALMLIANALSPKQDEVEQESEQ